ncbi:MAG: hypothetical protein ABIN61_09105 [candidate division WOR-3 bacterium]
MVFLLFLIFESDTINLGDTTYINVTGRNTFFYQGKYLLSGSTPPEFYPFTLRNNVLQLNVDGKIKSLLLEGEAYQGRREEENTAFFSLKGEHIEGSMGDIPVSLGGLLIQNKSIRGVKLGLKSSKVDGEGFYSLPRGTSIREKIKGDGTSGPFQLANSPVLVNTEIVKIGIGLALKKLERGTDYRMDYTLGRITLLNRILSHEEVMEVEYEYEKEEGKSISGGEITLKPFSFLSIGGSGVNTGGYSLQSRLGTEDLNLKVEGADDGGGNKGLRVDGGMKNGIFELEGIYSATGEEFNVIGKGLEPGEEIEVNGAITPISQLKITSSYRERNEENDRMFQVNLYNFQYNYKRYEGFNHYSSHCLLAKQKIGGVNFSGNTEFERRDSLRIYKIGGGIDYSRGLYGINITSSYGKGDFEETDSEGKIWWTPKRGISVSSSAEIKRSDLYSPITVLQSNYNFSSLSLFRSSGQYTIQSVRRNPGKEDEPGERTTGSFRFDTYPLKWFSFSYNPSFSKSKSLIRGTVFQNSEIHSVSSRIYNRAFSITGLKEWRKSYSLNYDDVKTQDNKEERERVNIMWGPLSSLSFGGEYSNLDGDGLYRILRPTREDSVGDTLIQYRTRRDRVLGLNTTYLLRDKGKAVVKYENRIYELRIPDSLPTATTENRITLRGEERVKELLNFYQEMFLAHKEGLEPFIYRSGEVSYEVIGFETGVSFIPKDGINGRIFFGYEEAYSGASFTKKNGGLLLYFKRGPIFFDGNGKYEVSSNPDYKTLELSINAGLQVE